VQLGCDELQGFLLGRPKPPQWLQHRTPAADPVATEDLAATG
jgi:EAL domain-containing protein (putative c-di-GMP-specific phosphodiesterase class I)